MVADPFKKFSSEWHKLDGCSQYDNSTDCVTLKWKQNNNKSLLSVRDSKPAVWKPKIHRWTVVGRKLTTYAVKLEHTIVVMGAARHTKKGKTEEEEEKNSAHFMQSESLILLQIKIYSSIYRQYRTQS